MTSIPKHLQYAAIAALIALAGCSTTQQITLAKASPTHVVSVVSQVPQDGNSPEMNTYLEAALRTEGISMKSPVAVGTRTTADVDAIVSYGDTWRWDGAGWRSLPTTRR